MATLQQGCGGQPRYRVAARLQQACNFSMGCTQHMVLYMVLWTRSICVIYNVSCNNVLYIIIVYTNNQWTPGDVLVDYDYTKVKEYLLILARHVSDTKDQLQQQSLAHQQQLLQLQQQLDTERRMRRSMALQLDKLQESSANISTGNIIHYIIQCVIII